jgi:hypothetical protein
MLLKISKEGRQFVVDDFSRPGSPIVGYGRTIKEAIGDYFHGNQVELDIAFAVDESAQPAETRRRRRELSKR